MKIYIDINDGFKCYGSPADGLHEVEESLFDGKCPEFIEGYRCKPVGYTWTDGHGNVYDENCKVLAPWKNNTELEKAQLEYDLADADNALRTLGAEWEDK